MIPEPIWTPSADEYHADTSAWGSSMLRRFAESPLDAWNRWVVRRGRAPRPTPEMRLGSVVHAAILEPDSFERSFVAVPHGTRSHTRTWKEAERRAKALGVLVVTEKDLDDGHRMAQAVLSPQSPAAEWALRHLVEMPGRSEYSFRWQHTERVACKVRFDRLVEGQHGITEVSLKTSRCSLPEEFWYRQFFPLRYDVQTGLYHLGADRLLGPHGLVMHAAAVVVICNEKPHDVNVVEVGDDTIDIGRAKAKKLLGRLDEALALPGPWHAPWQGGAGFPPRFPPPRSAGRDLEDYTG